MPSSQYIPFWYIADAVSPDVEVALTKQEQVAAQTLL